MTKPWAMARVASRRQLPKPRKMMGPVGELMSPYDFVCRACGHNMCSCDPISAGVAKLKAALLANPDYELRPYQYMKVDQAYPVHHVRTIFANQHTLNAFMEMLTEAGVPTVRGEQPKPYSITQSDGVEQKIKTVMQSAELYMTAITLGIDPSTLPGVETKPVEPRRPVCRSCDNTVGPGWNHCRVCMNVRRFGE
jgi:hypothetical protein